MLASDRCEPASRSRLRRGLWGRNGGPGQGRRHLRSADHEVRHQRIRRADKAITWWLKSTHNKSPNNRYTNYTTYSKQYKADTPEFIGDQLRDLAFVGLLIHDPSPADAWGHWITAWGDEEVDGPLNVNPDQVWVTDGDMTGTDQVQEYNYYFEKGADTTKSMRIDYANPHPKLSFVGTLTPTQKANPNPAKSTQKISSQYTILQNHPQQQAALDLHYDVATDVEILSYRTALSSPTSSWQTQTVPSATELTPEQLRFGWDFDQGEDVPYGTKVTLKTEFVVPEWNAMQYSNVYWTYDAGQKGGNFPGFGWNVLTPLVAETEPENNPAAIGGYVTGAFDLYADEAGQVLAGEYRFQHEYDYFQTPEYHEFTLESLEDRVFFVGNFRFGHNWWYLDDESLAQFDDWMTVDPRIEVFDYGMVVPYALDWDGLLPYPQITTLVPGGAAGDYNGDGFVGQADLDLVLLSWGATVPPDPVPVGWVNDPPAGLIGQAALDQVLLNWGDGTPPLTAIPEPATGITLLLGMMALHYRRILA